MKTLQREFIVLFSCSMAEAGCTSPNESHQIRNRQPMEAISAARIEGRIPTKSISGTMDRYSGFFSFFLFFLRIPTVGSDSRPKAASPERFRSALALIGAVCAYIQLHLRAPINLSTYVHAYIPRTYSRSEF